MEVLLAQPACNGKGIQLMWSIFLGVISPQNFCRPSQDMIEPIKPIIQVFLEKFSETIPDHKTYALAWTGQGLLKSNPFGNSVSGAFKLVRFVLLLSIALPILTLTIVSFIVVRSVRSWLYWWGILFVVSGGLLSIITLVAYYYFSLFGVTLVLSKMPGYLTLSMVSFMRDFMKAILYKLSTGIFLGGVEVGMVGLCMWVGSRFIKPKTALSPDPLSQ